MDIGVRCCLLCLLILGGSSQVSSQDAALAAAISISHATDAAVHAATGVPSKLAVPGTAAEEAPTIQAVNGNTPGALGGTQAAHSTQPTHDSKHGAFGGKMIPLPRSIDETTAGAIGKKEARPTHHDPGVTPGVFGGKKIPLPQSIDETTVAAIGKKEVHTLHPGHGTTSGAVKAKEIHPPDGIRDATPGTFGGTAIHGPQPIPDATLGSVGKKTAHAVHPAQKTTPALSTAASHHRVPDKAIVPTVEQSPHLVDKAHVKVHRPKHLISRIIGPPTVDPVVLQNDYIILCVCAPGIAFWLIILVIVTVRSVILCYQIRDAWCLMPLQLAPLPLS